MRAGISEGSSSPVDGRAAPHADGHDEPTLPVAAVARRLGVAPATLRTWDRRYGLGPSGHTGGKHRRYSPGDITRLEVMQRALLSGVSTAEAARYALESTDNAQPAVPHQETRHDPPDVGIELPRLARGLSTASLAMDIAGIRQLIADAVDGEGPTKAWRDVVAPVLTAIEGADRRTAPEAAQLVRDVATSQFARIRSRRALRRESPVLLAVDRAQDAGALYAAAAELRALGLDPVVTAAPATSVDVVVGLARGITPSAVVVVAGGPVPAVLFDELRRGRRHLRMFACGPGWDTVDLPSTVERLTDVVAVVERVGFVLLGS